MKFKHLLILLCICLFAIGGIQAQTCFGNHALTDADGIAIDNTDGLSSACLTFPAGPAACAAGGVSWISLTFDHPFIGDVQITISDGTTTVDLHNQTGGGADAEGTASISDAGGTLSDISDGETSQPVSGTLASLDASMPLTVCFNDFGAGDVYTNFGAMQIEYCDGSTCTLVPTGGTQPANDDICNATTLMSDTQANGGADNGGTTLNAGWTSGEPIGDEFNGEPASNFNTCAGAPFTTPGNPGPTVWYEFTATTSGQHCFAETTGFVVDEQMALYESSGSPCGDYSALTQIASSDDDDDGTGTFVSGCSRPYSNGDADDNVIGAAQSSGDAAFCVSLTAGTTYYLQVSTVSLYKNPGCSSSECDDCFAQFTIGTTFNINVVEPNPCASTCAEAATNDCNHWETPPNDISDTYNDTANNGGENPAFDIPLPADGTPVQVTTCTEYTHTDANSCWIGIGSGRSYFEDNSTNGVTDCSGNMVSYEVYDAACGVLLPTTAATSDLATAQPFGPVEVGTTYTICVTNQAMDDMVDGKCFLRATIIDITPVQCAVATPTVAPTSACPSTPFTITLNSCFVPTNVDIPGGLTNQFLVVYDTDNTTVPTNEELYDGLTGGAMDPGDIVQFGEVATTCAGTELVDLANFMNTGCDPIMTDIYLVPTIDGATIDRNCKPQGPVTLTTLPEPQMPSVAADQMCGSVEFTTICPTDVVMITGGMLPTDPSDPTGSVMVSVTNGSGCTETFTVPFPVCVPVELLYFTAEADNDANLLEWATATELENSHFEVERSIDGNKFEAIGKVDGAGTTVEEQRYSFVDASPLAVSYYRLKQVDFDGTYEYTDVVVVNRKEAGKGIVEVFPIPTDNEVTVQYEVAANTDVTFTLTDVLGRVVSQQTIEANAGVNYHAIDMTNQSTGLYFITFSDGKTEQTRRIVKN